MNSLIVFLTYLASSLLPSPTMGSRGGIAFVNPVIRGGSMMNDAGNGYGEPLNVFPSVSALISYIH